MKKNILIISATPIRNDTNMGKTLKSLFNDFNEFNLYQLYFSPEKPNLNICKSYYQIHEKQLLKSFFGLVKTKCGTVISVSDIELETYSKITKNNLYFTQRKNRIDIKILRELIWGIAYWKNKKLKNWINEIKPDIIFTIMHDNNMITRFVKSLSSKMNIPVIMFITDDYYNDFIISHNPIRKIYYSRRKRLNNELGKNVKYLIGCSEKATNYFKRELNIKNGCTIYTPSNTDLWNIKNKKSKPNSILKIRYFGNLGIGRNDVLKYIGKTLQIINKDGMKAQLEIYSSVTDKYIIDSLNIDNGSRYMGWVYGDQYIDLLKNSDIVVHVESNDESMMKRTWISVSTKIADYLGAGKCILAVGPNSLASIDHLKNAACVVTDLSQLLENLSELINNENLRDELAYKSRELSFQEHNSKIINKKFKNIFKNIISERL